MTQPALPFTQRRIRAYFAPVDRVTKTATLFDPAQSGWFSLDSPPAPWLDLGWVDGFERTSASTVFSVRTGSPAVAEEQTRTDAGATLQVHFQSWGKLQLALSAGTQQMNLLVSAEGAAAAASGGVAEAAQPLLPGSSATVLQVDPTAAASFSAGSVVVVDADYTAGLTGYVGAGVSGAYVKAPLLDVDYVRRVSLNVGRVASITAGAITLEDSLPAGVPLPGMKVSPVVGFCDREGSTFFQEWSALFVSEGAQGDRVLWHYPRLQSMAGIGEVSRPSPGGYEDVQLLGSFRALPIRDGVDGERVVCFRTYLPV